MITITLNRIRENGPCKGGWEKVLKAHKHLGMDTEFPLASVLTSNDLDDTIWCVNCLPEYDFLWRKFSVWCARQVEHLMTDERSKNALDVAWRHADGLATDKELSSARSYAWDAAQPAENARPSAWDAVGAAWDAAKAALDTTRSAAGSAAAHAVWSASRSAAKRAAWDSSSSANKSAEKRDTWAAAWDAAQASQQKKLTEILTAG